MKNPSTAFLWFAIPMLVTHLAFALWRGDYENPCRLFFVGLEIGGTILALQDKYKITNI